MAVGPGQLTGDGEGDARPHRRQHAGAGQALIGLETQDPSREMGVGAAIERDHRIVGHGVGYRANHRLRPQRIFLGRRHLVEQLVPVAHMLLRIAQKASIALLAQGGQQRLQGRLDVAGQAQLDRIAQAQAVGIEIDLDAARAARVRVIFLPRHGGAQDEHRVAILHDPGRGHGAEIADAARGEGRIVGQHRLAEQRLGHGCGQCVGQLRHLLARRKRPLPDQDRDLAAGIEDIGGLADLVDRRGRGDRGPGGGTARAGIAHGFFIHRAGHQLGVLGDGQMGDAAIAERRAAGAVGDDHRMFGTGDLDIEQGQAFHQLHRVDRLLEAHPDQIVEGGAGDGQHRRAVERRVIESVHQVDGAGPGGADAQPQLAAMLGESAGHEGGGLLMADADIFEPVLTLAHRLDQRIDAVADDPERVSRTPGDRRLDQDVGGGEIGSKIGIGLMRMGFRPRHGLRRFGGGDDAAGQRRRQAGAQGGRLQETTPPETAFVRHGNLPCCIAL